MQSMIFLLIEDMIFSPSYYFATTMLSSTAAKQSNHLLVIEVNAHLCSTSVVEEGKRSRASPFANLEYSFDIDWESMSAAIESRIGNALLELNYPQTKD